MREPLIFMGIGIVSIAVGWPLAARRVGPNRWYGLRVPATFGDEHVWYEANAATGRDLIVVGCVLLLVTAVLLGIGASTVTYAALCGTVFAAGSLAATIRGWRLANRLRRERSGPGR